MQIVKVMSGRFVRAMNQLERLLFLATGKSTKDYEIVDEMGSARILKLDSRRPSKNIARMKGVILHPRLTAVVQPLVNISNKLGDPNEVILIVTNTSNDAMFVAKLQRQVNGHLLRASITRELSWAKEYYIVPEIKKIVKISECLN